MDNEKIVKEKDAIVTMCLAGYRSVIRKMIISLIVLCGCWLCTIAVFCYFVLMQNKS